MYFIKGYLIYSSNLYSFLNLVKLIYVEHPFWLSIHLNLETTMTQFTFPCLRHKCWKRGHFPCLFTHWNEGLVLLILKFYNIKYVAVRGVDLYLIRVKWSQAARRQMRRRSPHSGPTQLDIKPDASFCAPALCCLGTPRNTTQITSSMKKDPITYCSAQHIISRTISFLYRRLMRYEFKIQDIFSFYLLCERALRDLPGLCGRRRGVIFSF